MAKANADSAETAISNAAKLVDRALTLAAQVVSFGQEDGRRSLADNVQSILEQLVAYSRTTANGRICSPAAMTAVRLTIWIQLRRPASRVSPMRR